jgi:3-carboxy-cis,cis-muconate cycloisomerase
MTENSRTLLDQASPEMRAAFSDRARLQGMLDFEAALAKAEAALGLIPTTAAAAIAAECRAEDFYVTRIARGAELSGNAAIPLIAALTEAVTARDPEAARFVHFGATSQDAIDTGLVLQLRTALGLFEVELERLGRALIALIDQHRQTLLVGRTWLQPALPIPFGLKAAGYLSALGRVRQRLRELRGRVLVVQFGGAVGTLASLGTRGLEVGARLARELELGLPDLAWHTQRDRVVEVGATLGLLAGGLGKLARDISLLAQWEVAEAFEPRLPGRGGSSTLPQKQNPVGCAAILAAAARIPGLLATLFAAMPQEHERGLGGWQAEWDTLPEVCLLAESALKHAVQVIEGLSLDPGRMQANLSRTRGVVVAEAVSLALAPLVGRSAAHQLVEGACAKALAQDQELFAVLAELPDVTSRISLAELQGLCDPSRYVGVAEELCTRALAEYASITRSQA